MQEEREKEGLWLSMEGGTKKDKARTIITFLCPPDQQEEGRLRSAEDGKHVNDTVPGEEVDDGVGGRLKFVRYEMEEDIRVLRLDWTTDYACENRTTDDDENSSSGHWGFFTWLIIM